MTGKYLCIDGSELPSDYPDIGFFAIDREVFAAHYHALSTSELGSGKLSKQWYARNPSIYTLLLSGGVVIGYCNAMPVTRDCFEALMQGAIGDGDIPPSSVGLFSKRAELFLYICGIAILPSHQRSHVALITLLRGVRKKFAALRRSGVRVQEVGAIAWTDDGKRLARIFDLSPVSAVLRVGTAYRGRPNMYFDLYPN